MSRSAPAPAATGSASRAAPRRAELLALALILVAGFFVRALYFLEARGEPAYAHPAIDAGYDDDLARRIAVPGWAGKPHLPDPEFDARPYLRPPGMSWFMAATYAVGGGAYEAPRLVQSLLGTLGILIAWWLGRRTFGPPAGLTFAALTAAHGTLVYWEQELQEPALLCFLLPAAALLLVLWSERPARLWRAAGAGALLGLAALVRPNTLLLAAAAVAWMAWIARGVPAWRPAVALLAAAAVVIAPVTLRNALVSGEFVPITTNLGVNLYIGNHAGATGFVSQDLPGHGTFRTCYDYPAVARSVEREVGRPLTDSEVSGYFTRRALEFVRSEPAAFLGLLAKKALLFWGPDEIPHNKIEVLDWENSAVLRRLPTAFPPLLSAAVLGFVLAWGSARRGADRARLAVTVLAAAFVLAWFLSVLPFFAAARYRAPILPFLMFFSAVAVGEVAAFVRARRVVPAGISAAAFAALLALSSRSLFHLPPDAAKWHVDRGLALNLDGLHEAALAEFRLALARKPDLAEAHYSTALTLGALGRVDEAIGHYERAIALAPGHAGALSNLGSLRAQRGRTAEAVALFERAAHAAPENASIQENLALALELTGRADEAIAAYRAALRLAPGRALSQARLAALLAARGAATPRPDEPR